MGGHTRGDDEPPAARGHGPPNEGGRHRVQDREGWTASRSFRRPPSLTANNGVPRSAWFKPRRVSTWHRPYRCCSCCSTTPPPRSAATPRSPSTPRRRSGFQRMPELFELDRVPLPAVGLADRGLGPRRLRPPLPRHRHGRVQARLPGRSSSSPLSCRSWSSPRLLPVPCHHRHRAGRHPALHCSAALSGPPGAGGRPRPRPGPQPAAARRHAARGPRGLHRGHPGARLRPDAYRHQPHRGVRRRPLDPDAGAGLHRPGRDEPGPGVGRGHDRGLRLGQRASPESCAGWPGSWRAPASTWWSPRS